MLLIRLWRGLWRRLWRRRTFRPHVIQTSSEGENFDFYIGTETGRQWYELEQHNSWPELKFIRDHLLEPGNLIVECGSHHGYTTIVLSRWAGPDGKIIAFEANPANASVVRRNLKINAIRNVELHPAAVGNQPGKMKITNESNSAVMVSAQDPGTLVDMVRLDDLLSGRTPQLIKIDVEGYETEVVKGLQSTLSRRQTNLAIEVHCDALKGFGSSALDLFQVLELEQYDCWLGTGDEAKDGIVPFVFGRDEIPALTRIYLFAAPKMSVGKSV